MRPTVRLRLTVIYGACFVAVGAILLAFNYLLVRNSIDTAPRPGAIKVFAPAFVAQGQAVGAGGATVVGPGGQFTIAVPAGVPIPIDKTFILPPEAGYGPVSGTVIDQPVTTDGQPLLDKVQGYATEIRQDTLSELVSNSAMALGGMSILSVLLGWVVAGRVLRPLHQITATARRLGDENLHERIALDGPDDELKELADTFDGMLGRLESAFDSQKRFVANASHELRTPLAVMRAEVDVTLADPAATPEDFRAMAVTVQSASERCEALIDGLLVLARSDRGLAQSVPVDLADVVGDAAAQSAAEANAAGVHLDFDLRSAGLVGDPAMLSRLAGNLLENAIRYNLPAGGWAHVATRVSGNRAVLIVTNSGAAVPPGAVAELFEPFRRLAPDRTSRAASGGAGLGLSIVRSVAAAHGGEVQAAARPDGGLEVTVIFPLT